MAAIDRARVVTDPTAFPAWLQEQMDEYPSVLRSDACALFTDDAYPTLWIDEVMVFWVDRDVATDVVTDAVTGTVADTHSNTEPRRQFHMYFNHLSGDQEQYWIEIEVTMTDDWDAFVAECKNAAPWAIKPELVESAYTILVGA
jgi:hypothetical protein